jgi:CRP-like cAMP-binding protein
MVLIVTFLFLCEKSTIKIIKDTGLDPASLASLTNFVRIHEYKAGAQIFTEGETAEAGLHLMQAGKVQLTTKSGMRTESIEGGGYFGDKSLEADAISGKNGPDDATTFVPDYTVTVVEDSTCGVLTLADCRLVFDTKYVGKRQASGIEHDHVEDILLEDLERHALLGAGTFGQVWLVTNRNAAEGKKRAYALKIQSKYELIKDGQVKALMDEKNIMEKLKHPFIIGLVDTYQDEQFVYMLLHLVQGGELFSVMDSVPAKNGLPEKDAIFYAAGVADGLAYMHRRSYVYRDLKPGAHANMTIHICSLSLSISRAH